MLFADEVAQIRERSALWAPPDPVLFYGSSSIRLWRSLPQDFPDLPVLNHGFGGSTLGWCIHYFEDLVVPFAPRAVVLYGGDNDLGDGKSPGHVRHELAFFMGCVRERLDPRVYVTYLSIKPSPAREGLRPRIREANRLCAQLARREPRLGYVDVHNAMLDGADKPRPELYADDGLHLSRAGYAVWRECLRPSPREWHRREVDEATAERREHGARARARRAGAVRGRLPAPATPSGTGGRSEAMSLEHHCWYSPALEREMELNVHGHAGPRVIVFPTRCGRHYDYDGFGLVDALASRIREGRLQLFCLDSVDADALYCFWKQPADRMSYHEAYERFLLDEVLPFSERHNPNPVVVAHGCSLGAYHAMNFALRSPDRFSRVVALSGRYDLTEEVDEFRDLLDGHRSERVYLHNPLQFMPNLEDEALLQRIRELQVVFAIGEEDPFLEQNQRLSGILSDKGVEHIFEVFPGYAHRPARWREMVQRLL